MGRVEPVLLIRGMREAPLGQRWAVRVVAEQEQLEEMRGVWPLSWSLSEVWD